MVDTRLPRLLVVDDESDNLSALNRLLRKDFQITGFEDPREALESLKKESFDCLLSDQRMPGMTGSKFFEEAIKIDPRPTRVLLTGFADLEAVIEAVNNGQIWRYVSKPWEPKELLRTLKQASERTILNRNLEESRLNLERAINHLRAKDWSRERLLQILLHEFRTLPQIVEALKSFNNTDVESVAIREKFLSKVESRLQTMAEDVGSLLSDEKSVAGLPAETFSLNKLVMEISLERKVTLEEELDEDFKIYAPRDQLKKSLLHFIEIMGKNTAGATPLLHLEGGRKGEAYLSLRLKAQETVKPKALAHLDAPIAWAALLEPFVGAEDLMHHSTGLRVETAHHVRILSSLASRPDFSVSHDTKKVELVFSFRSPV